MSVQANRGVGSTRGGTRVHRGNQNKKRGYREGEYIQQPKKKGYNEKINLGVGDYSQGEKGRGRSSHVTEEKREKMAVEDDDPTNNNLEKAQRKKGCW